MIWTELIQQLRGLFYISELCAKNSGRRVLFFPRSLDLTNQTSFILYSFWNNQRRSSHPSYYSRHCVNPKSFAAMGILLFVAIKAIGNAFLDLTIVL